MAFVTKTVNPTYDPYAYHATPRVSSTQVVQDGIEVEVRKGRPIEVALRIQSNKMVIENSADAIVYTIGPKTFRALLKQRTRWYLGFMENVINYKHLFSYKYGNLGLFILPASFISVALVSKAPLKIAGNPRTLLI